MSVLSKPLAIILLGVCLFASCKSINQSAKSKPFITINQTPVYSDEFVYVFNKNNFKETPPTELEIDEYLELFINFKLKVEEARSLGYHNTASFLQEFQTYKDELSKPYLTENVVTEQLVRQAYDRMKEEVNVSHILILSDSKTTPEDTVKAYNKISEIRLKAINGEDFNKLAKEFSEDPSARMNEGNLGYFSALQMVYPFEEQAFNTNPGEISPVFKTSFGYHILKVHDRRPSKGKVKVSHIMIRATEGISKDDSLAAKNKIDEIYLNLNNGGIWFDLCQQFSEDLSTKSTGGTLPWLGTGNMIPEFEEAAFALEKSGDFSKPIKTAYGWHILKLEDRKELEPFEEIAENIKNMVKKDSRSELSKRAFIERLKNENNFAENRSVVTDLKSYPKKYVDLQDSSLLSKELFKINNESVTIKSFLDYLGSGTLELTENQISLFYTSFVEESLVKSEKNQLATKYPEYRMLLKEYEEGILLFQLMDERIWSKAIDDSVGLRKFFEQHLANYQWNKRLDAVLFNASNETIRDKIKPLLEKAYIELPSAKKELDYSEGEINLSGKNKTMLSDISSLLKKNKDWGLILTYQKCPINDQRMDTILNFLFENSVEKDQVILDQGGSVNNLFATKLVSFSRTSLEKNFNSDSNLDLKVEEGVYEKGENQMIDLVTWQEGIQELNSGNRFYLVEVKKVLPPGPKKLEEIRGMVISDYQNLLEKEWVKELREKYPIIINDKIRKHVYKKLSAT